MTASKPRVWTIRECALIINDRSSNDRFGDEIEVIEAFAVKELEEELQLQHDTWKQLYECEKLHNEILMNQIKQMRKG